MSTPTLDYSLILADLETKKAAIEATIASIRALVGAGVFSQSGEISAGMMAGATQVVPSVTGNEIPDGAFFGRSVPEAAKLLLEIVKKKQTTREIADGLRRGGIESTSSNFVGIVHAVLNRARKTPNSSLVKIGSYWGLKEWYPKGIVSAGSPSPTKKRKKKALKSHPKAVTGSTSGEDKRPQSAQKQPGTMARLADYLQGSRGIEFTAEHLGEKFGMQTNGMAGLLARLANKGTIEKLPSGKYRCPSTQ